MVRNRRGCFGEKAFAKMLVYGELTSLLAQSEDIK